jgi:peptidylprolyl isomerase
MFKGIFPLRPQKTSNIFSKNVFIIFNNPKREGKMDLENFGKTAKVYYTVRLEDGTVFDSNFDSEPLIFITGANQVIPGFEKAVLEMAPGTTKTVKITSEEAYGPYNEELITTIDRSFIPEDLNLQIGQYLSIPTDDSGNSMVVTVLDVTDKEVKIDANHPLAGKDLIIDIKLIELE